MRVGGDGDGGYLIPDDLNGIEGCFSPGVSDLANFEVDLLALGFPCFLADNSVEDSPIKDLNLYFEKMHLSSVNTATTFTLESWVNKYMSNAQELILQMDIEGAEYETLLAAPGDILRKFRIIVIEFHYLDHLTERFGSGIIKSTIEKLLADFHVVHIHPNNARKLKQWGKLQIPPTIEVTFIRKDRVGQIHQVKKLPHSLDRDNVMQNETIELPKYWFS
jgi:hypothetical protein